jgi:hypothetical protein
MDEELWLMEENESEASTSNGMISFPVRLLALMLRSLGEEQYG